MRRFLSCVLVLIGTGVVHAEGCGPFLARDITDLEISAMAARLDARAAEQTIATAWSRLGDQVRLADRLARQQNALATDRARLRWTDRLIQRAGLNWGRRVRTVRARERFIARVARDYAAAVADGVTAHHDLQRQLRAAVVRYGEDVEDPQYMFLFDGVNFHRLILAELENTVRDLPGVIHLVDQLVLAVNASNFTLAADFDAERDRALHALSRLGQVITTMTEVRSFKPRVYEDSSVARVTRAALVRSEDEWQKLLRPMETNRGPLRFLQHRLHDLTMILPAIRAQYETQLEQLRPRETEVLTRLDDLVHQLESVEN